MISVNSLLIIDAVSNLTPKKLSKIVLITKFPKKVENLQRNDDYQIREGLHQHVVGCNVRQLNRYGKY